MIKIVDKDLEIQSVSNDKYKIEILNDLTYCLTDLFDKSETIFEEESEMLSYIIYKYELNNISNRVCELMNIN